MDSSMRFSLDRRLPFGAIPFSDFRSYARYLVWVTQGLRPGVTAEVLTCEDEETYRYSTVTIWDERVTQALLNRKRYPIGDLTREIWERSLKVEVHITHPIVATTSCSRSPATGAPTGGASSFTGNSSAKRCATKWRGSLPRGSILYRRATARSMTSDFNLEFSQAATGISLPS